MSDLFARIGPKVSTSDDFRSTASKPVKFYPNKSWVREGFQVKKTSRQVNTNGHGGIGSENDSDSSRSHDGEPDRDDEVSWEPHVSSVHRPQSPGVPSLMVRMGLSPGLKVEEDPQAVPNELATASIPPPRSFKTPKPNSATQASKSTSPVQLEQTLSGRDKDIGRGLERTQAKNSEIIPSSLLSVGKGQIHPNIITSLKTSSPHGNDLDKGPDQPKQQESARRSPRVNVPHISSQHVYEKLSATKLPTPPSSASNSEVSSGNAAQVAPSPNLASQPDSSALNLEPRTECSSEAKFLLGRIVEQNTARRVAEKDPSSQFQPVLNSSSVLTGDFCETVAKTMDQAQKEIQVILQSPQVQSLLQAALADQQASNAALMHENNHKSISSTSLSAPPRADGQSSSRQVQNYTPSPSPSRREGARSPVHIPPEMLAPGQSQQYTSGHSRSNYMDLSSPTRSGDRGSSVEYNDNRYHSRPDPYPPRGRGWTRGRGFFAPRAGWRGRGRGRGRGNTPYDSGNGHYRNRSDDYHRQRSFSPRRSPSPPPKQRFSKHGYDDDFRRSRSRSRSQSPGKGRGRYRSPSRGRSVSPPKSRSRSPAPRAKPYRSKHDYKARSPPSRRPSDYSRSQKYTKRSSRSISRSVASSRSRSPSTEHHDKKKHRLRDKLRSISPRNDKYSSKKRKYRTPSPEERRKRRHSSVSKHRDRSPSRDRERENEARSSVGRSRRASEEPEDKRSMGSQQRDPTPALATRSRERTPQPTSESIPATTMDQEVIQQLPCHNVPGLWSARLGNEGISTFQCTFEIDELTAQKWDIPMPMGVNDPRRPAILPKHRLNVQICCYLKPEIESLMQSLQPGISPQEVANKIFGLSQSWPSTRDLVITIHPKLPGKKTWLSFEIGPGLDIAPYIHQGNNIVEFVQLCDMSKHMFVLLSSENDVKP